MQIRNRVKEYRVIKASELLDNPKNWRTHPKEQRDALDAVLKSIGFAGAELVFETPNGLMLIDGHLRRDRAGDGLIPCLITDLTQEEADQLLATFDPIAAMAQRDQAKLNELLASVDSDEADLRKLLDELESEAELEAESSDAAPASRGDVNVEEMELQPEEHYDFILVLASNVNDWNRLVRLLDLPHIQQSRTHRRIGMARAVRAEKVLELIDRE